MIGFFKILHFGKNEKIFDKSLNQNLVIIYFCSGFHCFKGSNNLVIWSYWTDLNRVVLGTNLVAVCTEVACMV